MNIKPKINLNFEGATIQVTGYSGFNKWIGFIQYQFGRAIAIEKDKEVVCYLNKRSLVKSIKIARGENRDKIKGKDLDLVQKRLFALRYNFTVEALIELLSQTFDRVNVTDADSIQMMDLDQFLGVRVGSGYEDEIQLVPVVDERNVSQLDRMLNEHNRAMFKKLEGDFGKSADFTALVAEEIDNTYAGVEELSTCLEGADLAEAVRLRRALQAARGGSSNPFPSVLVVSNEKNDELQRSKKEIERLRLENSNYIKSTREEIDKHDMMIVGELAKDKSAVGVRRLEVFNRLITNESERTPEKKLDSEEELRKCLSGPALNKALRLRSELRDAQKIQTYFEESDDQVLDMAMQKKGEELQSVSTLLDGKLEEVKKAKADVEREWKATEAKLEKEVVQLQGMFDVFQRGNLESAKEMVYDPKKILSVGTEGAEALARHQAAQALVDEAKGRLEGEREKAAAHMEQLNRKERSLKTSGTRKIERIRKEIHILSRLLTFRITY